MYNSQKSVYTAITLIGEVVIGVLFYGLMLYLSGVWGCFGARASWAMMAVTYMFVVYHGGVILHKRNTRRWQIPMLVLKNVILYAVMGTLLLLVSRVDGLPLTYAVLYFAGLFVLSSSYRLGLYSILKVFRARSNRRRKIVLVGSTSNNAAVYHELTVLPSLGNAVEGYFDFEPNPSFPEGCKYLGRPEEVIDYLRTHKGIYSLFCCLPSRHQDVILPIIHYCVNNLVHFYSVPNVRNYLHNRMHLNMMGAVPYLSLYVSPLANPGKNLLKRTFDVVFSLAFLCTLFIPILLVVSVITKLTMPGPIFFRQKRNGLNNKTFYCIKFRSMKVNADADRVQATKDDPRKTKWGDIMRKLSIDELPQFINVLLGDMSVVGPRPHMEKHTAEYSQLIDKYMMRHWVKPGITGWSQVTGFRGETKELWQMEGRIKGDIWYIEHWSFGLDLFIIYKTVANAIKGDAEAY